MERHTNLNMCPNCGETDIEGDDGLMSDENGKVVQEMYCNTCHTSWQDVYTPFQRRVVLDGKDKRISLAQFTT